MKKKFHMEVRQQSREVWIDWMRVTACFLVMMVHSSEPFYLGAGNLVLTRPDVFWVSFFDSLARSCVPLFVVASSYLQFPLHYSTGEFFRRRVVRILPPFFFWTVFYALVWGEPLQNFKDLLLNFNYAAGHLWFVYMLLGIYMLMPLLSPWAEKAGRREVGFFLSVSVLTTCLPYVRELAAGDNVAFIIGPGGIPMPALYPLWGEASWNYFGIFYYLSGFVMYVLLGLYLRKFMSDIPSGKAFRIAVPCWLAGFAICFSGFIARVTATAGGVYPIPGDCPLAATWETPWSYASPGVFLMTLGVVLAFRNIRSDGRFYRKVILPLSGAGYGMYLCHMFFLSKFSSVFRTALGTGTEGCIGIWTTPAEILLTLLCTFTCTAVVSVLIRRIPRVGNFIMG